MMAIQGEHGIQWTNRTWNPIRGCTRVSEGCRHCYAETVAARFSGPGMPYEGLAMMTPSGPRWTGTVRVIEEHLLDPLRWTKPSVVFTNSMSDLFHEGLSDQDIDRVFVVMALSPKHTFQVLTKRAARMRDYFAAEGLYERWLRAANVVRQRSNKGWNTGVSDPRIIFPKWIWLGVSVEDQKTADERIPALLDTPAPVRFVSAEPLLNRTEIGFAMPWQTTDPPTRYGRSLAWVIVGGESGAGSRRMDPAWAWKILKDCHRAGVPAFMKQAGTVLAREWNCRDRKGGDMSEWPEKYRVREMPQ
jgi:protein gp37